MNCPLCKYNLITDPDEPYFIFEDAGLSEIQSIKHICDNKDCELYHKSFWNDYGEYFTGELDYSLSRELFPESKYAAFNSISKRHEVEIYKHGLKDKTYLSPYLTFGWLKPVIEHNYKGDDMGNVLSKSYKLKFLYKGTNSKSYNVYYTSGVSRLLRKIKKTVKDINHYKNTDSIYSLLQIYKWYNFGTTLKWYDKIYRFYIKILYNKILTLSENYSYIIEYIKLKKEITEKDYLDFEEKLPGIDILNLLLNENCYGIIIDRKIREKKLLRIMKKNKK